MTDWFVLLRLFVCLLQLNACDGSGNLSFDYYTNSACNIALAGSSPGYPNDGTYHTTTVTAQAPCVTLPNNNNNVYALSCTPNSASGSGSTAGAPSMSAANHQSAVNLQHGILAALLMTGAGIAAATALSN